MAIGLLFGWGSAPAAEEAQGLPAADASPLLTFKDVPEENLLIFAVQLNQYSLSKGILLYQENSKYFISLSGMTEALEFPIEIDVNKGMARGWFLNDDRKFALDLRQGFAEIEGRRLPLDPGKIHRLPDDLYLESGEFAKWFPVLLEIDFQNLVIDISSKEPLPIEARIAKENRRERLNKTQQSYGDYEALPDDAPLFSRPYVDFSLAIDGNPFSQDKTQEAGKQQYSLNAAGIVLKQDAQMNMFASRFGKPEAIRVVLGRKSAARSFFGPLGLREYGLGDINGPNIALVSNNVTGRGVMLSTYELDRLANSAQATLRGELHAGWEVELYRNGILLGYQTESKDGQYEFTHIDTVNGLNVFKLIFYGPQGQKHEEFKRYYSDRDVIKSGAGNFRLSVNQKNQNLILESPQYAGDPDFGSLRLQAMGEYGLTDYLTAVGSVSSLSLEGARDAYYQAGLRSSLGGISSAADIAVRGSGGYAFDLRAKTGYDGVSVIAAHNRFIDYASEVSNSGWLSGDISSSSSLTMNGALSLFQRVPMPFTLRGEYAEKGNGDNSLAIYGRLSKYLGRFAFTAENGWLKSSAGDVQWDGAFLTSAFVGQSRLRGIVNYRLKPHTEIASVRLSGRWRLDKTTGLTAGAAYENFDRDVASLSLGFDKDFDALKFNVKAYMDNDGQFYAGVGLSFGFGLEPRSDEFHMANEGFANSGLIAPRVFLDRDNDLQYSEGDALLEGVRFASNHSTQSRQTGAAGTAFLTGMPLYQTTYLEVNEGSLKNPFLISSRKGVSMTLRPGYARTVDFPIQETGEIDGAVYRYQGGVKVPAQGIAILLKDQNGAVLAKKLAAYDGYYLITRIPPGAYRLGFDPQQLMALGLRPVPDRIVDITGEDSMIYGADYVLERIDGADRLRPADDRHMAAPPSADGPRYGLHILSFLYQDSIAPGWEAMRRVFPEILNGRPIKLIAYDEAGLRHFTRLIAGGYASRRAAQADCDKLKRARQYCRVLPFEGKDWTPPSLRAHQ